MKVDLPRLFSLVPPEGRWTLEVEGEIPADLDATVTAIGPGVFFRPDRKMLHWLDGDGFVSKTRLQGGEATLTTRFVETLKRREELDAGKLIYRGFGTAWDGDALVRGVAAACPNNVSVTHHGGRLLAWGEQGLPLELNPDTLETKGEHRFERLNPMSPMAAHPKVDPKTGEMIFFGQSFSRRRPTLTVYHAAADGTLTGRWKTELSAPAMVHDFAVSEHYVGVHLGPYDLDIESMLTKGASVVEALSWEPERPSSMAIWDRRSGELKAEVVLDEPYCLHIVNAFEDAEGHFVVDLLSLEHPVYGLYILTRLFDGAPQGWPTRLVFDVESGTLVRRQRLEHGLSPDLPNVDPRQVMQQADRCWMLDVSTWAEPGAKIFDRLVSCDFSDPDRLDVWEPAPGCCLGMEPVVLPGSGDQRWLVCEEIDPVAEKTDVLLFDADDLSSGPRARMRAPFLPVHFHSEGMVSA